MEATLLIDSVQRIQTAAIFALNGLESDGAAAFSAYPCG